MAESESNKIRCADDAAYIFLCPKGSRFPGTKGGTSEKEKGKKRRKRFNQ